MTPNVPQDVTQWMVEVRTLQRQLADTRKERDQAYNSAATWRRLYDNEACQRRREVQQLQAQLDTLQRQLKTQPAYLGSDHQAWLQNLDHSSQSALQEQLQALVSRCQELSQNLEAERQAHAQTRQTLTAALGDTFQILKGNATLTSPP